jgi:hypothetical protein
MIKLVVIFTAILTLVGLLYGVAVGVNIAQADDGVHNPISWVYSSTPNNVHYAHHPSNAHDIIYGKSIIADNFYHHNGNYDIQYDGNTCMRWLTNSMPVVIPNPSIITYSDPIDDFDLLNIIACEA